MKVAVVGAGAIGGYVGGRLAEAGEDVHLIARGAHLEALRANGLRIESPLGDAYLPGIPATSDPAEIGPVDLVLFTVKLGDTEAAARGLSQLMADHTRIVTLQNGIDSKQIIAGHVAADRIAPGIIYLGAEIKEPGVIGNPGGAHRIVVDHLNADRVIAAFLGACARAPGLEATGSEDGERTVWGKFINLVAFSGITCLARLPIGAVYASPPTFEFFKSLLFENVEVARASGLDFDESHCAKAIELFANQPYEQKSSMLIDMEAGKSLELEWLSGRIQNLGHELGVPTPANSAVYAALAPYSAGRPRKPGKHQDQ